MAKSTNAVNEIVRSHMPDDSALCIMSKLPIKSLKRLGCICKSWASLLENPHFMSIYRNNFISNHRSNYDDTSLILEACDEDIFSLGGERYENVVKLDWPNPYGEENPRFLILDSGSITGILCLYVDQEAKETVFWNPTTGEFKIIPPSPLESVPPYQKFIVNIQGFGYDHVRDGYKLIRTIHYFSPINSFECEQLGISWNDVPWKDISHDTIWEMYSLRSNSWRKLDVDDSVVHVVGSIFGSRSYMDGMCHWWFYNYDSSLYYTEICYTEMKLESFDLVNEVFYTTPLPLKISPLYEYGPMLLVVLNGSIASILRYNCSTSFHILILGELGVKESWTKLFTIGPLFGVERPIGAGNKGDTFFRKNDGQVVWFDLGSQKIQELGVKGMDYSYIITYKENPIPIGGESLNL